MPDLFGCLWLHFVTFNQLVLVVYSFYTAAVRVCLIFSIESAYIFYLMLYFCECLFSMT